MFFQNELHGKKGMMLSVGKGYFFAADVNFLNTFMYLFEEAKEYPLVANVSDQYKLIYEMFSRGAW